MNGASRDFDTARIVLGKNVRFGHDTRVVFGRRKQQNDHW